MNQRETGGNGRPMVGGGHSSVGQSFDASSRRENLHDCSPSRHISGDDQNYQDFISWRSQHGNTRSRRARMDDGGLSDRRRPTKHRYTMFHGDDE